MYVLLSTLVLAAAATISLTSAQSASGNGQVTFYDNAGFGACGGKINANTELLAAVSKVYWKGANPNADPLCKKCVEVKYNGKSVKVPIKDKCPGCDKTHVDLSKPAFSKLADPSVGRIKTASWKVVNC